MPMNSAVRFLKTHSCLFLFVILLPLLFSQVAFAQGQRGKISGKVVDAKTGEALIGANILISGTTLGAATNIDGDFVILNIPPGTYDLVASLVGYAKTKMTQVVVNADRTTNVKIELKDEAIQMDQVVVVAEKQKIIKDQTSSSSTIDENQIKAAPVEGLRGILDLSSGFQKNERGTYSVRGSGAYELNFQINGIEQINSATTAPGSFGVDKANNSWKYDVNPLGVQQVQLISGGFSAEYGNAQAGVVKVVLKEGAPKLSGEARVEFRPPGQYHFGPYVYDENSYEWQKWGTLDKWMARKTQESFLQDLGLANGRYDWLYQKIKNNTANAEEAALWNNVLDREIRWAYDTWIMNHRPSDDNPLGVYDYRDRAYTRYMVGLGGPLGKDPNKLKFFFSGEYKANPTRLPTAERTQVAQNYILNVTYQPIANHKIKAMLSYQSYKGGIWSGSEDIRWSGLAFSPPSASYKYYVNLDPIRTEQTVAQSLNYVYTIDNNSFAELTINHQNEKYELPFSYLAGYTQEVDRLDSLYDKNGGSVLKAGSWWESTYFRQPDALSTLYYQDTRTDHFSLIMDYTNQIVSTNLIKAGVRLYYWDMFNNGVNSRFKANALVATTGIAEYYRAYPYNIAFYLQDKMEYSGMVANIGVRVEAYNFQSQVPVDLFNVPYLGTEGPQGGEPDTKNSETQYIVLPRIGLSFPIGETTAFRIQYGHFSSMPTFSNALSSRSFRGWSGRGNPNLDPKKTIQYEFGLQQMLDEAHRLDIALYYNDRVTQIGLLRLASFTGSTTNLPVGYTSDNIPLYRYTTFANNTFGASLGLEVTFEKVIFDNWSYRLSYSLSQTTEGNYGPETIYPGGTKNIQLRNYTGEFLSGSDRTHNFRAVVQYAFKQGEGLEILGFRPFENTVIALSYSAQSGVPFTYITDFDLKDIVNNRRYPLESNFDLNITKNVSLDSYRLVLGIRVMNLFDNKWLTPVSNQDLIDLIEYGTTVADPGVDPLRISHIAAPFKAFRNVPRQIFFTIGFGF